VLAVVFSPQRVTHSQINPWNSRKGLIPTSNNFPTVSHFRFFKKFKNLKSRFFSKAIAPAMFRHDGFLCFYQAYRIPCCLALIKAQEVFP
jgi:hypothetical protein